ncbi:MAG: hypothetical protein AB7G40_00425 [Hyphomonadaceae bacterium]
MNLKAFCAILTEVAALERTLGAGSFANQVDVLVASLKPYHRRALAGFFTLHSTNQPSAQRHSDDELSAAMLAKVLQQTSRLLRSAGANAKAAELAQAATEIAKHGDARANVIVEGVEARDEAAAAVTVSDYVKRLNETELNSTTFENVVQEIAKLNPQVAIKIAAGYVQGRASYPSRPKALTAIRNKRYAQERFLHKTGKL